MSSQELLRTFALAGIPVGLVLGLALGPVANRDAGWGGYASLRRRAARLGHVAAVMLPLLGGFYGSTLSGTAAPALALAAGWAWVAGSALLVLVLFATAWRPAWRYALPVPASSLVLAAALFAVAGLAGREAP
jgi:hypothetical protein